MTTRTAVAAMTIALLAAAGVTRGQATTMPTDVPSLQARIITLEAQVATLQQQLAAATGKVDPATYASITTQARERMRVDLKQFTRDQLAEIEQLYQVSNDRSQRGTPAVKASLDRLIADYPTCNRAGCAVLYLAQWAQGADREALLRAASDKHGDAYYGDGCQVGPYALFQLAADYGDAGAADKAKAIYDELRTKYPTAIDHGQQTLVSQIPK